MKDLLFLKQAVELSVAWVAGTLKEPWPPGASGAVACEHLNYQIQTPLHGPIQCVVNSIPVRLIELIIVTKMAVPTSGGRYVDMPTAMYAIMQPIFTAFFEDHAPWYQANVEGDKNKWAEPWGFARIIRNAMSHGGRLNIDNPKALPVTWRGLTYGPSDNKKEVIGWDISFGDLMILLIDLSDDLDKKNCPIAPP